MRHAAMDVAEKGMYRFTQNVPLRTFDSGRLCVLRTRTTSADSSRIPN
jgi:hypothetical protein